MRNNNLMKKPILFYSLCVGFIFIASFSILSTLHSEPLEYHFKSEEGVHPLATATREIFVLGEASVVTFQVFESNDGSYDITGCEVYYNGGSGDIYSRIAYAEDRAPDLCDRVQKRVQHNLIHGKSGRASNEEVDENKTYRRIDIDSLIRNVEAKN